MNALFLLQVGVSPSSFTSLESLAIPSRGKLPWKKLELRSGKKQICIRFLSRSTAADKELSKPRTNRRTQLPRVRAATKSVEAARRVTACLVAAYEGRSNAERNCQCAAWESLLPSCVQKLQVHESREQQPARMNVIVFLFNAKNLMPYIFMFLYCGNACITCFPKYVWISGWLNSVA